MYQHLIKQYLKASIGASWWNSTMPQISLEYGEWLMIMNPFIFQMNLANKFNIQQILGVWAQGIHDREVNLLRCSHSIDEALLESDVPSKMMNLNWEKERQAMAAAENHPSSLQLASQTYWDSSTARTLFGAQKEDVNMLVTSNWKIEKLCC